MTEHNRSPAGAWLIWGRSATEIALAITLGWAGATALRSVYLRAPPHPTPTTTTAAAGRWAFDHVQLPARADDVASYEIHARLDPTEHTVAASGVITWTNDSSADLGELYVHLYLNAFRNEESVWMRERRTGSGRGVGRLWSPGSIEIKRFAIREMGGADLWPGAQPAYSANLEDLTDMRVRLPDSLAAGRTIHIDVEWLSSLPNVVERTGYDDSFHMVGQWFPKLAKLEADGTFAHFPFHHLSEFYADFGTYDVTIDVPETFVVGATGPRVAERAEGGRRIVRHVQDSVHDFAFTAWDGFRVHEREFDGVAIRCLAPQGYDEQAAEELETAEASLRHFGVMYGAYPYRVLTIVHPPASADEAGGMEYPTLITTGGAWFTPRSIAYTRGVALHEFGHQYFYGLVASNEHDWPFLDEGVNTFAEVVALDSIWGPGSVATLGGLQIDGVTMSRMSEMRNANADVIAQPAHRFSSMNDYGALVYSRTAIAMLTLDRVYGPGKMREALGHYARVMRYQHPTPRDLLDAVSGIAGEEAANNLRLALFERGWVDYAISNARCRGTDSSADCSIELVRHGDLKLPVITQLRFADGTSRDEPWDGQSNIKILRTEGPRVIAAVIDPDHHILIDSDYRNNGVSTMGTGRAWRVLDRLHYWGQVLLAGAGP